MRWRSEHGYGPHSLAPYVKTQLLPALTAQYPLTGEIHLVAWDYTASAALRTAHGMPAISSVTLFEPDGLVSDWTSHRAAEIVSAAGAVILALARVLNHR